MIVKSASKLGLDPATCIVIGDTIYDIQAGLAAGALYTIGVLTGTTTRDSLKSAGAGAMLQSVKVLLDHVKN